MDSRTLYILVLTTAATAIAVANCSDNPTQPGEPFECGTAGLGCPDGQTCELPAGQCEVADLRGSCVPTPEVCTGRLGTNTLPSGQVWIQGWRPGQHLSGRSLLASSLPVTSRPTRNWVGSPVAGALAVRSQGAERSAQSTIFTSLPSPKSKTRSPSDTLTTLLKVLGGKANGSSPSS